MFYLIAAISHRLVADQIDVLYTRLALINNVVPTTGHYTQMVWRTTEEVGCATASGSGSVSQAQGGGSGEEAILSPSTYPGTRYERVNV